ncbi:MAG: flr 2 [Sporomusa sp.]|jgi:flavin reductase (DIM6/NTAB) family NADH-FMN oxidoreductase RutF|nr:flr 2 [Sporomusa sp.]
MKKSLGAKVVAMPSPVWIVGTYGDHNQPNIMTVAWGGICCSVPPCIAISVQQSRLTHSNITKRKAFTINVPSRHHLAEADYAGIASGKYADKFSVTSLTPVRSELVDAPYIQEFLLVLECKLLHTVELGRHTQFIGQIIDAKADEAVLSDNENPAMASVNPLISSAADRKYYALGACLGQTYHIGLQLVDKNVK